MTGLRYRKPEPGNPSEAVLDRQDRNHDVRCSRVRQPHDRNVIYCVAISGSCFRLLVLFLFWISSRAAKLSSKNFLTDCFTFFFLFFFLSSSSLSLSQGTQGAAVEKLPRAHLDATNSRDVPVAILRRKIQNSFDEQTRSILQKDLNQMLRNRVFLKNKVFASKWRKNL